jgi:hypothetical protein
VLFRSDNKKIGWHGFPRHDNGSTFVEVLVSIVLLGTVGVAVLTAVAASARGASVHHDVADVQAALATAADVIADTDSYVDCGTVAHYQSVVDATLASNAADVIVADVRYSESPAASFDATCDANDRLHLVSIQSSEDSVTHSATALARPMSSPTTNTQPPPGPVGGGDAAPTMTPGISTP